MKDFFITYWSGPPMNYANEEKYKEIVNAGFTIASVPLVDNFGLLNKEDNLKVLDLCSKVGLKYNLGDIRISEILRGNADLEKTLDEIVDDYSSHPALESYYITDEPSANQFEILGKIKAYLMKKDSKHYSYINLFPNYASDEQLGSNGYEDHVEKFMQEVQPELLSYDHYHFMKNEKSVETDIKVEDERDRMIYENAMQDQRAGFFDNIEIIREKSIKYKIPFMVIVLLVEHGAYRNLTEAELRWEAFQSLAYGASGISYFTYWTPFNVYDELWNWQNGMVTVDGKLTKHYEDVYKINKEIKRIGDILVNCSSEAVYHVGNEKEKVKEFVSTDNILAIRGGNVTVGMFDNGFTLLANKEYDQDIVIEMSLKQGSKVSIFNKKEDIWEQMISENDKYFIGIRAGDGELLKIIS